MEKKWFDYPETVAKVVIWKFIEDVSNLIISDRLKEMGYDASKDSVEKCIYKWGCSVEIKKRSMSLQDFDSIYKEINKRLGITDLTIKQPKLIKSNGKLILVVSDFHCPFYREDLLAYIIKTYKGKVDTIIVNGDFWDQYGISRFIVYNPIPLIDEFRSGIAVAKILCENFANVIFTTGNHEQRVFKHFINKGIGIDKMFLVNYDWNAYLAELFPNLTVAKSIIGNKDIGEHEVSHFYLLGNDCLVGHFEVSGGQIGRSVTRIDQWMNKWRGLIPQLTKVKLVLEGHSHQLLKTPINGGEITLGETGCICKLQEYAVRPDIKYSPSSNGYWEVFQEDGETDINKSNYVLWK